MYYVMSDIHGEYEKYLLMLELIHFSEKDFMFILGDVVDRGQKPVSVLLDMMSRPNVFPIMGNHEVMALYLLEKLTVNKSDMNLNALSVEDINDMLSWLQDGGETTLAQFQRLNPEQRRQVLEFISEFSLYETLDINEKTFILVHAGLGNFREDKKLKEYTMEEMLLTRDHPDKVYFQDENIWLITGHTPTPLINGKPEIYHSRNHLHIDCGACFDGGKLACVCLDTMQEFYI